jgi:V/A-type H+-transporting ATPase subunit B
VLSPEVHARGVYPPVDALGSLSRLMRKGAGPGRTRADHLDLAAQQLAALARARTVRDLADLIGLDALSRTDRAYLDFQRAFEQTLVNQRRDERRPMEESLDRGWSALGALPRRELTMLPVAELDRRYVADPAGDPP